MRTPPKKHEQPRRIEQICAAQDAARDDAVRQRRAAYHELVDGLLASVLKPAERRLLHCLIDRDGAAELSQRGLAKAMNCSVSTVNGAVKSLTALDLVRRADRVFRLDTNQLRGLVAELEKRQQEAAISPSEAADRLAERSAMFGHVRPCSANSRTVEEYTQNPVHRTPYRKTVTGAAGGQPNTGEHPANTAAETKADRDQAARNYAILSSLPEWRGLQQEHFRDGDDRPLSTLAWDRLGAAFYAACDAGVIPCDSANPDEGIKRAYKAACLELAANNRQWAAEHPTRQAIQRPAIVLRKRVAAGTLWQVADQHLVSAKRVVMA